eukprot:UN06355
MAAARRSRRKVSRKKRTSRRTVRRRVSRKRRVSKKRSTSRRTTKKRVAKRRKSTRKLIRGSRRQVFAGKRLKTRNGDTKNMLMKNKRGKIVTKKAHKAAMKKYKS